MTGFFPTPVPAVMVAQVQPALYPNAPGFYIAPPPQISVTDRLARPAEANRTRRGERVAEMDEFEARRHIQHGDEEEDQKRRVDRFV